MGSKSSKSSKPVAVSKSETITQSETAVQAETKVVDLEYVPVKDAVIISCYFNPTKSKHRYDAFLKFHDTIKGCEYRLIECVIGDQDPVLQHLPNMQLVRTKVLLWHKEALLNIVIRNLPSTYNYVFWLDGDILFTNKNWLVESVEKLKEKLTVIQVRKIMFE